MASTNDFGAGRLALADARLGMAVMNYARHRALARAFGVDRQQANLLTFVIALGAAEVAVEGAKRMWHAPLGLTGRDWGAGAIVLREGALSMAGPSSREVPGAGTLLTVAMVGAVSLPALRRGVVALRGAEHRLRVERQRRYAEARQAFTLRRVPNAPV